VALPRCKQVVTRLARVSALLASFSKASMSCCSASSHRPMRMLHTALPFSRRVCTAKQQPWSSYARNVRAKESSHGIIMSRAICWLPFKADVDVAASLQGNSMASAQCVAHSNKSEQHSVFFTTAAQLCPRALCTYNLAVLQAMVYEGMNAGFW